ncbi:MAG: hypothetical protein ACFFDN_00510 [Candidatus Hodarchaeota archaeon]
MYPIRWKLLAYPNCALCDWSEQYQDETFVCMFDYESDGLFLKPINNCDSFDFQPIHLPAFFQLVIERFLKSEANKK